jgi:ABC-type branched-subunit amino acid transport system substrate-binding protein
MNSKRLAAISTAILCSLLLSCRKGEEKPNNTGPIPIGIISSFTGPEARFGQAHRYGYEMALEGINSSGRPLARELEADLLRRYFASEAAMSAVEELAEDWSVAAILGAYKFFDISGDRGLGPVPDSDDSPDRGHR